MVPELLNKFPQLWRQESPGETQWLPRYGKGIEKEGIEKGIVTVGTSVTITLIELQRDPR
jgi:hypothetical protein